MAVAGRTLFPGAGRGACALALALWLAGGCGDDAGPAPDDSDAALPSDAGPALCDGDDACSDGMFCNGVERCRPGTLAADERGCTAGAPPCDTPELCDESEARCLDDCATTPDADGDGQESVACGGEDCDDRDPNRFAGNAEVCDGEAHDEDCDPTTFGSRDTDGDGFVDAVCCNVDADGARICGEDCDDFDRTSHPESTEVCDLVDNDCDGDVDEGQTVPGFLDADSDLHGDPAEPREACAGTSRFATAGDDCDDENPRVHGSQPEICDAIDNDCDERVDEDAEIVSWYPDLDGDGFGSADGAATLSCEPPPGYSLLSTDCDDTTAAINPAADELCDGRNNDCDVFVDEHTRVPGFVDADGDAYGDSSRPRVACPGAPLFATLDGDCDDRSPAQNPGHPEVCDELDNDCDEATDEEVRGQGYVDADHDLRGDDDQPITGCLDAPGFAVLGGDCDDGDPRVYTGQPELCDDVDNDCDDAVDEEAQPVTWYRDADGDGYGDPFAPTVASCAPVAEHSLSPLDCDDTRAGVNPAAPERCNGIDDDCDGAANFIIAPGDGEDDDADGVPDLACPGVGADCDDLRASRRPGALELCDGLDNDCDDAIDEDATLGNWYPDADRDGYGRESAAPVVSCVPIPDHVGRAGDCDDQDPSIHPAVADLCDGVDEDCDGALDESAPTYSVYRDADADGFAGGVPSRVCELEGDVSLTSPDCDDGAAAVHPGQSETCNLVDDDCDGSIDEGVTVEGYADADGDLHGDPDAPLSVCSDAGGVATRGDDCDDENPAVHEGQAEVCDGLDNDCDGTTDENAQPEPWYPDADGDGYGSSGTPVMSCAPVAGHSLLSTDCDDSVPSVNPAGRERCNGSDDDCDGRNDEGLRGLSPERCDGSLDDDCDGTVDEGCGDCVVGLARACGSDEGDCAQGIQVCDPPGLWSRCVDEVGPTPEACDGRDNDCDGAVDERPDCP